MRPAHRKAATRRGARAAIYVRLQPGQRPTPANLANLRDYASAEGWELVGEYLDHGPPSDKPGDGWHQLMTAVRESKSRLDVILVRSLAEVIPSTRTLVDDLRCLHLRGIELRSHAEPWIQVPTTSARASPRLDQIPNELQDNLARYLERSLEALDREAALLKKKDAHDRVQAQVSRMVGRLLLLSGYALVLGIITRQELVGALFQPDSLARFFANAKRQFDAVAGAIAIPETLHWVVLAALGSLGVFISRVTSRTLRANIGGALFVGILVLTLVALSAAATRARSASAPVDMLSTIFALAGFVGAALVCLQFTDMLLRIARDEPQGRSRTGGQPPLRDRLKIVLERRSRFLQPASSSGKGFAFVALPIGAILSVLATAVIVPRPFWLARLGILAFLVWCVWGFIVTPSAVRIPVWSMAAWAALFLLVFAFGPVSIVFAAVVIIILMINVDTATLRRVKPTGSSE